MKMEIEIKEVKLKSKTKLLKFMNYLLRFTGQNIFFDDTYSKLVTNIQKVLIIFIVFLGIINPIYEPNMTTVAQFIDLIGPYSQVS